MNCAVHTETPAVAYCRTCGKALCAACKRDVRGVIYCENCLAQRLQDVMPPAGAQAPGAAPAGQVMVVPSSGPNPALAAVLAAFFPFGVGAVYCAQYAKGLAHMVIFAFLVWGASSGGDAQSTLFGFGIAFFYFYQIVDAYRSAKALQLGQPAPDPFGLGQMVGTGGSMKMSNVPTGALVLIALGVLFLLGNLGLFEFRMFGDLVIPIFLIGLGVWIFVRRSGMVAGEPGIGCGCANCRARGVMAPVILVTLGGLLLLSAVHVARFGRTWPVLLLVIGLIKVLQSNASSSGHLQPPPTGSAQTPPPAPPAEGEVTGEVGHV
ncbi:MAG TPA: B-box zinc finger protein [Terriglobales bacterium]|nr:B-box zinc finger protein [Terriglobales bacterium]